jgi:hypothetical protein
VPEETQNPIVALASKIKARRGLEALAERADVATPQADAMDASSRLEAFGRGLQDGAKLLNAILGRTRGVTVVRLEKPLRLRVRFAEKRVALDLDAGRQLVLVSGNGLDGEYQFAQSDVPALMNLSKLSTEAGYHDALTPSALLKIIAAEAELPRPAHLDEGPLQF